MDKNNVRVPQPTSLKTALELYYRRTELNNADIIALFGKISSATVSRLKRRAREKMVEDNVPSWNATSVNTRTAFKAWGLNIDEIESRYLKLKELGIS